MLLVSGVVQKMIHVVITEGVPNPVTDAAALLTVNRISHVVLMVKNVAMV